MFVVSFPEIALVSAGVAFIFGSLFLPPFYHDILLYGAAAMRARAVCSTPMSVKCASR
jgi:hypothetical protein